jgi:hypothetical protein
MNKTTMKCLHNKSELPENSKETKRSSVDLSDCVATWLSASNPEPVLTIPSAARAAGVKYHALLGAVNAGRIRSFQPFGKRRYLLLSDVHAFIRVHESNEYAGVGARDHNGGAS